MHTPILVIIIIIIIIMVAVFIKHSRAQSKNFDDDLQNEASERIECVLNDELLVNTGCELPNNSFDRVDVLKPCSCMYILTRNVNTAASVESGVVYMINQLND